MLKSELDDPWDWIVSAVADDNLREVHWINRHCTFYEIAKQYAIKIYKASAQPNG